MPTNFFGKDYLDTTEAASAFQSSKQYFSKRVRHSLKAEHFYGKAKPWYALEEVEKLIRGESVRIAAVRLYGIQSKWEAELEEMGYIVEKKNREVLLTTLPEKAIKDFGLPTEQCVRRGRIAFVSGKGRKGTPICYWDTYYPLSLVADIHEDMKHDETLSIRDEIEKRRDLTVGSAIDGCMARTATFEELSLFQLINNDPVFVIDRPCYAKENGQFLFYTSMVLLGSWFMPTYKYTVS